MYGVYPYTVTVTLYVSFGSTYTVTKYVDGPARLAYVAVQTSEVSCTVNIGVLEVSESKHRMTLEPVLCLVYFEGEFSLRRT